MGSNEPDGQHDLIMVGGGIGGIISLKYAKDAGLDAILLEKGDAVGGLWRDLPAWQDLQIRREDWSQTPMPSVQFATLRGVQPIPPRRGVPLPSAATHHPVL
jgi:cation diffusion facilitator CzcD-associated flavoprotein CzcO